MRARDFQIDAAKQANDAYNMYGSAALRERPEIPRTSPVDRANMAGKICAQDWRFDDVDLN
jgi:hypothetical protein